MRIFKVFLNKKGVTLVEVLVSAAMTAIVSLGVATMMQNSFKEQRRVVLLDTLKNQKSKFESMIRDQAIWNSTMNNATHNNSALFTSLRASSAVSEVATTSPVEFKLVFTDNSLAYDLLGPSDNTGPYAGFTEKGQNCSTFRADAAGNDDCPFSYRLLISADCPSGTSCVNPQLKLVARLVFNPAPNGALASYKSFVSAVAGIDISDSVQDSRYDAVVKRTATSVNRSFRIISRFNVSSSGCTNAGGGTCSYNTFAVHPRTATHGWYEDYDPHNLVAATEGANPSFQFRETGYYGCIISAPAFATGLFRLGLVNAASPGNPIGEARVTAGRWSQATAVVDVKFSVNSTSTNYQVWQGCASDTGAMPGDSAACTLGVFTDYYSTPTVVSMSCYKIDRAM